MSSIKNLKGYSETQRNMAYAIRGRALKFIGDDYQGQRLHERLMKVTSPMFFIKYQALLESGCVADALSKYSDENFNRRAKFAARKG